MKALLIIMSVAFLVSGCLQHDKAIFVTSTSLALLEGDTKPAGASIAYKRVEGYLGPNNADGTAPPVIAAIQSDGKIFNPKIRQLYATGEAATAAASGTDCDSTNVSDSGKRQYMFFGTSTTTGISVGTTSSMPDSFVFGFKRKELSVIPLVEKPDAKGYVYPSVLASIDTTGQLVDQTKAGSLEFKNNQIFATGDAACVMAKALNPEFIKRVRLSVGEQQRMESARALNCYAGVRLSDRQLVWRDADFKSLFHEDKSEQGGILASLEKLYAKAVVNGAVVDANVLFQADRLYSASVFIFDQEDTERLTNLAEHSNFICGLSRANQ